MKKTATIVREPCKTEKPKLKDIAMTATKMIAKTSLTLLFTLILLSPMLSSPAGAQNTIAFVRNGDVWLMNPDGTNQRPHVANIGNASGHMSWSPDGKLIAFGRRGSVQIRYPAGGGGQHAAYDLFYAFIDSTNNFWMGITETLGAQQPTWSSDGSKIAFTYDLNATQANATWPNYQIGIYNVNSRKLDTLDLPKGSKLLNAMAPSFSPDGTRLACVIGEFEGSSLNPRGLVIINASGVKESYDQLLEEAKANPKATAPSWSPDGKWIAYISNDLTTQGLFIVKSDLTGVKKIWEPKGAQTLYSAPSWSPDSKQLVFGTNNKAIYKINVDGTGATLISGPGSDEYPAWSRK